MRRFSSAPVFDASITQKIRTTLIEDGHAALAIEQITQPIAELEEAHALLMKRVVALEMEKVNWQTESGVYRAIQSDKEKTTGTWAVKAWLAVGGLALAAAGAALNRLIEKHQ